MPKPYLACLLLLITTTLFGQNLFTTSIDLLALDGNDRGIGIVADTTGIYLYHSGTCANNTLPCAGLVKVTTPDVVAWKRVFFDSVQYINPSFQDGITQYKRATYLSGMVNLAPQKNQFFVKKIDNSNGQSIWEKVYRPDSLSAIKTITTKPNGNLLIYGQTGTSEDQFLYLAEMDTLGEQQWERTIDLADDSKLDFFGNADLTPAGDIAMAYVTIPANGGGRGAGLAVTNAVGNLKWSRNFAEEITPHSLGCPRRVRALQNGGFVYQYCSNDLPYDGDHTLIGLDSLGTIQWEYVFDSYARKIITNITVASNGDILGCGVDYNFPLSGAPDDLAISGWAFRMTAQGELLWERNFYQPTFAWLPANFDDLTEMPDGRIALTGRIGAEFPDGQRHTNIWLVVVDENGCLEPDCSEQYILVSNENALDSEADRQNYFRVFPNPATEWLQVELLQHSQHQSAVLQLFSAVGQLVEAVPLLAGEQTQRFRTSHLAGGLYFMTLVLEGKEVQTSKLVVK